MGEIEVSEKDHLRKIEVTFREGGKKEYTVKGILFVGERIKINKVVHLIHDNENKKGSKPDEENWVKYGKYSWGIKSNEPQSNIINFKFIDRKTNNIYELWEK